MCAKGALSEIPRKRDQIVCAKGAFSEIPCAWESRRRRERTREVCYAKDYFCVFWRDHPFVFGRLQHHKIKLNEVA